MHRWWFTFTLPSEDNTNKTFRDKTPNMPQPTEQQPRSPHEQIKYNFKWVHNFDRISLTRCFGGLCFVWVLSVWFGGTATWIILLPGEYIFLSHQKILNTDILFHILPIPTFSPSNSVKISEPCWDNLHLGGTEVTMWLTEGWGAKLLTYQTTQSSATSTTAGLTTVRHIGIHYTYSNFQDFSCVIDISYIYTNTNENRTTKLSGTQVKLTYLGKRACLSTCNRTISHAKDKTVDIITSFDN